MRNGTPLQDLPPIFVQWVSSFRFLQIAERSIEAKHKLVSAVYKRCPAAGPSYVSGELRFHEFEYLICHYPREIMQFCYKWKDLVSNAYLDQVLATMVGGSHCTPTCTFDQEDRCALLYRSGLDQQFFDCGEIREAIKVHKAQLAATGLLSFAAVCDEPEGAVEFDIRRLLLSHIRDVTSSQTFYSFSKDYIQRFLLPLGDVVCQPRPLAAAHLALPVSAASSHDDPATQGITFHAEPPAFGSFVGSAPGPVPCDQLVFRIVHKNPTSHKRPFGSFSAITDNMIAIQRYKVIAARDGIIRLVEDDFPLVEIATLFEFHNLNCKDLMENMLQYSSFAKVVLCRVCCSHF